MRHPMPVGRFPFQLSRASIPWRGAKEVSGVALVVAQEVPTSSSMAVPHGPAGVARARRRMRGDLRRTGVPDAVIDDAVLILSELLSNACRHGRPLERDAYRGGGHDRPHGHGRPGGDDGHDTYDDGADGAVRAAWRIDERARLTVEVTDGGGPTRPVPATPSITSRGGRGLNIITALSENWGVRDGSGEVTVWATLSARDPFAARVGRPSGPVATGTGRRRVATAELGPELGPDLGLLDLDGLA
ncbi:ATP-binding protein [Streptomyces pactum]